MLTPRPLFEASDCQFQTLTAREEAIHKILQAIHASLRLEDLFEIVENRTAELLTSISSASIFRYSPDRQQWELMAACLNSIPYKDSLLSLILNSGWPAKTALENFKTVKINDVRKALAHLQDHEVNSDFPEVWLLVPLKVNNIFWGSLVIGRLASQTLKEDTALAELIAEHLSIAIGQAVMRQHMQNELVARQRAEAALQQKIIREQSLHQITTSIYQSLGIEHAYLTAAQQIAKFTDSAVSILKYIPERHCWSIMANYVEQHLQRNTEAEQIYTALSDIPDEGNPLAARIKRFETVCIEDTRLLTDPINQAIAQFLPGAWLMQPIKVAGKLWGCLSIGKQESYRWSADDIKLAEQIAAQTGIATYQSELFEQLQRELSERQSIQEQLRYNSLHDSLTHLPNRAYLMQHLEQMLNRSSQLCARCTVLFIDIDRFKLINDSMGHVLGNVLLTECAKRLKILLHQDDFVARLGGDEFVVVLPDVASGSQAVEIAKRLVNVLHEPFSVADHNVHLTVSIGIAINTAGNISATDLVRNADIAMYRVKATGRNGYQLFDPALHLEIQQRMFLEQDLRAAIQQEQFEIHYQPIVDLHTGLIVSVEALIRWQHPQKGRLSPDIFIPIAAEAGLLTKIDRWVRTNAFCQVKTWQTHFPNAEKLKLSLNLSPQQLQHPNFLDELIDTLLLENLEARYLVLEITEEMLVADNDAVWSFMHRIEQLPLQLAIDDFGTGYSSLSYLHRFPIDALKIDRSFIQDLAQNETNQQIVETVVALSNRLNIVAVAEGAENSQEIDFLREIGCELVQGYYFSEPQTAAGMEKLLQSTYPFMASSQ